MSFKPNKKVSQIVLAILAIIAVLLWTAVFVSADQKLYIHFYDVGQGDAIYIRTPAGHDILIDGGPDATVLAKLGRDMPFYDRKIELVISTHPHADHLTGLIDILKRFQIDQVLSTGVEHASAVFDEWKKILQEKNIPLKIAQAGQKIRLGKTKMYVLYPKGSLAGKKIEDLNNTSIVCRLVYGQNSALFTGDAGMKVEQKLLDSQIYLKSDVLKVGHHGSKGSTSKPFLEAVDPKYAIISVGKNAYGHPSEEVLERLKHAKLLRTDQDGDIKCTLDGKEIRCERKD